MSTTIAPLKLGDVILYVPESTGPNTTVIKSPDKLKLILELDGVIIYPLGALGTRPEILWGTNPFIARGTKDN